MTQLQIRAIQSSRLRVEVFERAVEKGLDKGAGRVESAFEETMTTFRRKFPINIDKRKAYRFIWVDGEVYYYISEGTSIRWALMSSDWKSKTRPGRMRPGGGRGRVVVAGRRAMQRRGIPPRPGIRGRKFDKQIVRRDGRKIQQDIAREVVAASRNAF